MPERTTLVGWYAALLLLSGSRVFEVTATRLQRSEVGQK